MIDDVIGELDRKLEKNNAIERKRQRRKGREMAQNELDQSTLFANKITEESSEEESAVQESNALAIQNQTTSQQMASKNF